VDLARHYEYQGDVMADDPGDEDHRRPDPTPSYEEGLDSINRAVELGANGFAVLSSRAKLADALGQQQAAISFGQEALRLPPLDATVEGEERAWLQEMVARNSSALPTPHEEKQRDEKRRRIRARRRQNLPLIVHWVFDSPEN
jgi:hypothetical protein